jgi:hypothetical protein
MPDDVVAKGETVITELHKYLRGLFGVKLVELADIIHKLWLRLYKLGVRVTYTAVSLTSKDLGIPYIDCIPNMVFYLNEEAYPDVIRVKHCSGDCLVYGEVVTLNATIKPNTTVMDFVRAVVLMMEEYAEIRRKSYTTKGRRNIGSIMDIPISELVRDNVWDVNAKVGGLEDHVTIHIDPDYEHHQYKVTLQKTPIECNYILYTSSKMTPREFINLFNKHIAPFYKRENL